MPYIERELAKGTRLHSITRHFVGAFHGVPGARAFRRHLAENGVNNVLNVALIEMRITGGHPLHELRLDHQMSPTRYDPAFCSL